MFGYQAFSPGKCPKELKAASDASFGFVPSESLEPTLRNALRAAKDLQQVTVLWKMMFKGTSMQPCSLCLVWVKESVLAAKAELVLK